MSKIVLSYGKYVSASFVAVILCGCASGLQREIEKNRAALVVGTVSVQPSFNGYDIVALVESKHYRMSLETRASQCQRGYGSLKNYDIANDTAHIVNFQNLVIGHASPPDKLFAQICSVALPIAEGMENQLTEAQRRERSRRTNEAVSQMFKFDERRAEQARHDQAIRDVGNAVSAAIRQQAQTPVKCAPDGDGVTCRQKPGWGN